MSDPADAHSDDNDNDCGPPRRSLPMIAPRISNFLAPVAALRPAVPFVLLAQFLLLAYNPLPAIPAAADWRAGFEFIDLLKSIPGPVFLPQFPAYLSMVGKPAVAHGIAVCDLGVHRPDLVGAIRAQVDDGHYAAAFPWTAEVGDDANGRLCRPRSLARPFHPFGAIPRGGAFFAARHQAALGTVDRFDSLSAIDPPRNRR